MYKNQAVIWLVLLGLALAARGADDNTDNVRRFKLQSGMQVEGQLIKETDDYYFLDMGFDILKVPRSSVAEAIKTLIENTTADSGAATESYKTVEREGAMPYQTVRPFNPGLRHKEMIERVKLGVVVVSNAQGLGSGFIIDDLGHIITNNHVIGGEKYQKITLLQLNGKQVERVKIEEAPVLASSQLMDIALLKIPDEELDKLQLHPLRIYDGPSLQAGEQVYAVGNPGMGDKILEYTVTDGIISSPNRNINDLLYIQTNAAVNPGNSGGPMINSRGEVVGLVTLKASFQEGIAFALPAQYIHLFLQNDKSFEFDKQSGKSGYRYLDPMTEIE
ncbi:trypsin-like peptidase domain-containing protein [Candidatus Sumerlaeota bacterium]|nr:trypsin-like peptidase domain-containing protein [Candidatus Sumerlaeota bacterium]